MAAAVDRAERILDARMRQMELRLARVEGSEGRALAEALDFEAEIRRGLEQAIRNPDVQLDSVGLVIVSSDSPEAHASSAEAYR